MTDPAREGRGAVRWHFILVLALVAGAGVWIWRVYGFAPLRVVDSPAAGAAR